MTVLGIDISKWNGNWDANKAKLAGASFAFIKASQATYTDPEFIANWQKAKDAGILRGAYHYLDYTKPGAEQANYFADLLKNDPGELPPVIDYEVRRTDNNPAAALKFLRECLDQLIKRTELFEDSITKRPMIYVSKGMWTEYGDQTNREYWIQFPLWSAHWTTSSAPLIPATWSMWHFWQFTSKGPGEAFGSESLDLDFDRFNGTLNELLEFAGVRIPIISLSEKFEEMDDKVAKLEVAVSTLNPNGTPVDTGLVTRVNDMEGIISNLGGTITTFSTTVNQRIALVEQKIAVLESTPVTTVPTTTPTIPPASPVSSSTTYATCITAALNVRSGPGVSYPQVAGLQYGQRVKVINRQNGWAQFENPAGWSNESYLTFDQSTTPLPAENVQTPAPTPTTPTTPDSYGICNTSGLNVRSGPGVTFPIVGGLTYGQRVKILSHKTGWAQIETPSGWCNESYLSFA